MERTMAKNHSVTKRNRRNVSKTHNCASVKLARARIQRMMEAIKIVPGSMTKIGGEMERTIIDIHPLDMAELFDSTDGNVDVLVLLGEGKDDIKIPEGTIEFRGQLYRQTTSVAQIGTKIS
jgi:hypothetical protein